MKGDLDKRKKRKGQSDEMEEFRWIENKKPKLEETSRGAGDESENNINGLNNGIRIATPIVIVIVITIICYYYDYYYRSRYDALDE